jgi:hypothetical protein
MMNIRTQIHPKGPLPQTAKLAQKAEEIFWATLHQESNDV